jgi:hypothetical protein
MPSYLALETIESTMQSATPPIVTYITQCIVLLAPHLKHIFTIGTM